MIKKILLKTGLFKCVFFFFFFCFFFRSILDQLYAPLARGTNDQKSHLAYVISISGNKESMPHLERLTHDPNPKVAQEAIRALKNLQARL